MDELIPPETITSRILLIRGEKVCDEALRFHFGTSKKKGGRRYLPYVFTEQGVAMLSGVLNSKRAALVNVAIMRAFVKLRRLVMSNKVMRYPPCHPFESPLSRGA